MEGVASTESSWGVRGDKEKKGAQIDMLIFRNDHVVNLCEMKFLSKEFEPNANDEIAIRQRITTLLEHLSFKQTVHLTLVTIVGLKHNVHSGIFHKVVSINDLFG